MAIKGLPYFNLQCWNGDQRFSLLQFGLLKWRSKVFSTSIWTYGSVDQRSSLLRSKLLKCWSKVFSTLIWVVGVLIQGFSTSIWSLLKCRSRASLLRSEVLHEKSQNLGTRLLNYESFFIPLFFWDV